MFKKAMLFLASFLLASAFAYAEAKFTVSGEATFQYDGDVYICLLTMEEFRDIGSRLQCFYSEAVQDERIITKIEGDFGREIGPNMQL